MKQELEIQNSKFETQNLEIGHVTSMDRSSRCKGFTLIEVVVALAILGVGLTAIIELFSGGLRLARASMEYTKAVNYARMKTEEMTLKPVVQEGTEAGESDDAAFRWEIGVKKVNLLSIDKSVDYKPPVDLFQVKIDVFWKSGGKERSASIESFRAIKPDEKERKS